MKMMPFAELCARAEDALASDFFPAAPAWTRSLLEDFYASDFIVRDRAHRYNLVRAIGIVERTNREFDRDFGRSHIQAKATRVGKTERDHQRKREYACPCKRAGAAVGHASKSAHDKDVRKAMKTPK